MRRALFCFVLKCAPLRICVVRDSRKIYVLLQSRSLSSSYCYYYYYYFFLTCKRLLGVKTISLYRVFRFYRLVYKYILYTHTFPEETRYRYLSRAAALRQWHITRDSPLDLRLLGHNDKRLEAPHILTHSSI